MKVQVEDVSSIEKRLSIEVEPTFIERELSQAYAALSHQVKMPGFRPGKIPRRMLEKHYRTEVEADVLKRVQLLAFYDAIKEHNVPAIGDPHFSGGKIEAAKAYTYTARVEVKPTLAPKEYKGLKLKKFDTVITEERLGEQLKRMAESRTQLTDVTDRDLVNKGDLVTVDFDATLEGKPFPGNTGRDVTIEVIEGQLIDGNLPQLEGAKKGEQKAFDYAFPADYRVEEVKGKTAQFTVTVKAIKAKQVPAIDDALAVQMGVANLNDLKERMRKDLERSRRREVEGDEREDVFKKLVEKNAFDVPAALVNRGIDMMLEGALGSMSRSGMDLRSLNLDWNKLREDLRPRSENEVRGQLLLEAIAKVENLTVTDDDVEQKMVSLAEEAGVPPAMVKKEFSSDEARVNLKARLLDDKAIALVKQHATFE
jgi:trigger factor